MKNPNSIFSRFLSELGTPHTKIIQIKSIENIPTKTAYMGFLRYLQGII